MSRISDVDQIALLGGRSLLSADLVKISFGCTNSQYTTKTTCELNSGIWTDDINLCTFHRDVTTSIDINDGNGNVVTSFQATPDILSLPEVDESLDMSIDTVSIDLAAITNNWLVAYQRIEMLNRPVWIWRALFNPDTLEMVGLPFLIFSGFIVGGNLDFTITKDGSSATLEVSNQFYDFEQVAGFRCNVEEHQEFYPNDTGFKNTSSLERNLEWM